MYEVIVSYLNTEKEKIDTMLCESKPSLEFRGDYIILNCGNGQQFSVNIDTLYKIVIKYPLPDRIPDLKYQMDIHYNTSSEEVELLFSANTMDVDVKERLVIIKDSDNPIRIVNGSMLRSVKISSYTEKNLGSNA